MNVLHKVTLETLKKNKSRTLITIIGILLSTAMLTAVTTFVTSFRDLYIQASQYETGDWHLQGQTFSEEDTTKMLSAFDVESFVSTQQLGYAVNTENSSSTYTNYFYLLGMEENFEEMMSIHLTSGRYPSAKNEILLPEHLFEYKIGDTLTLDLGTRSIGGVQLWQSDAFRENEILSVNYTETYTITGFYKLDLFYRNQFDHPIPGNTLLTLQDDTQQDAPKTVYFKLKSPSEAIKNFNSDFFSNIGIAPEKIFYNHEFLRIYGMYSENFSQTILGLGTIFIILIMGSSISFIYSSFSISIAERTKQFGLLSSVGATKKQIHKMVLFESFVVSAIGIPLGILSGLLGIGVTFLFISKIFINVFFSYTSNEIALRVCVSPISLLITVLIAVITVLLSAWIPAKRATKVSAIQTIRQNNTISPSKKEKKPLPFTQKLFGISGILAQKYYHRNSKKYRTTIFSLSISIILFVTSWAFTDTIKYMFDVGQREIGYDLSYIHSSEDIISSDDLCEQIKNLDSIDAVSYTYNAEYTEYSQTEEAGRTVWVNFIPQNEWDTLLKKYHLDSELYNNEQNPLAIAVDGKVTFDPEMQKLVVNDLIQENKLETNLLFSGNLTPVKAGFVVDEAPYYIENGQNNNIPSFALIYPIKAIDTLPLASGIGQFRMIASDSIQAEKQLHEFCGKTGIDNYIVNMQQYSQQRKGIVTISHIFMGGFISLIALIAIANVFNSVSTNIRLRQRDFAMLETVGMSKSDFHKMLWYESLLYGIKALLYGTCISLLLILCLNYVSNFLIHSNLQLPFFAFVFAAIGIFVLIASTMFYAAHRIKKQELVELLRNENL